MYSMFDIDDHNYCKSKLSLCCLFSRTNALIISVNVYIIGEDSELTAVYSCHFIKNDIKRRHQKMAFSLYEVLKLLIDLF